MRRRFRMRVAVSSDGKPVHTYITNQTALKVIVRYWGWQAMVIGILRPPPVNLNSKLSRTQIDVPTPPKKVGATGTTMERLDVCDSDNCPPFCSPGGGRAPNRRIQRWPSAVNVVRWIPALVCHTRGEDEIVCLSVCLDLLRCWHRELGKLRVASMLRIDAAAGNTWSILVPRHFILPASSGPT
jgi:hypothetical protein